MLNLLSHTITKFNSSGIVDLNVRGKKKIKLLGENLGHMS
jgi:hypothetical protein